MQPPSQPGAPRPATAGESAWAAFRRLMKLVAAITLVAVVIALALLHFSGAPPRWELWAAVAGGVTGTIMLTGVLMGLVFVSNRSGHDDHVNQSDRD